MGRNMQFYIQRLKENGGDLWDVFDRILDNSLHQIVSEGFLDIFRNLIKSTQFSECLQKKTEQEKEFNAANQQSFDQMYQHLDHESCPVSREEFYDLMELQIMLQMMRLKAFCRTASPRRRWRSAIKPGCGSCAMALETGNRPKEIERICKRIVIVFPDIRSYSYKWRRRT